MSDEKIPQVEAVRDALRLQDAVDANYRHGLVPFGPVHSAQAATRRALSALETALRTAREERDAAVGRLHILSDVARLDVMWQELVKERDAARHDAAVCRSALVGIEAEFTAALDDARAKGGQSCTPCGDFVWAARLPLVARAMERWRDTFRSAIGGDRG